MIYESVINDAIRMAEEHAYPEIEPFEKPDSRKGWYQGVFFQSQLEEDLEFLNSSYHVDYQAPIPGRLKKLKLLLKKLYGFHMKPMWQHQNDINAEIVMALNQMRYFIIEQKAENEVLKKRIDELENSERIIEIDNRRE